MNEEVNGYNLSKKVQEKLSLGIMKEKPAELKDTKPSVKMRDKKKLGEN